MEKREFLKVGIGSLGGIAASSTLASGTDLQLPSYGDPLVSLQSAASLDKSGTSKKALEQIELIMNAVTSQQERIRFISDPIGYASELGVILDKEFASLMADEIRQIERKSSAMLAGTRGRHLAKVDGSGDPTVFPLVMAVAAVVQAAAAVVAAVSATYLATRWEVEVL